MVFVLHDGKCSRMMANNNSVVWGLRVRRIPFSESSQRNFLVNWLFLSFSESELRRRRVAVLRGGSLGYCSEGKGRSSMSMGFLPLASPGPATPGFCRGWNLFWMRDGSQSQRWVPTRAMGGRKVLRTPTKSPSLGQDEGLTQEPQGLKLTL